MLSYAREPLDSTPARADNVHDLLAMLAGEMMRLHREFGDERREFLGWLESAIEPPIESMSRKNSVRDYAGDSFDAWLATLNSNRARLKADPSAREMRKQLLAEWTASVAKLLPLDGAIRLTDDLIDSIVFALYGLDAAEIAVVRGETGLEGAA